MGEQIIIKGVAYDVVRSFGDNRKIVRVEGIYAFADRIALDTFDWGAVARPGAELAAMNELAATVETTTTVTRTE